MSTVRNCLHYDCPPIGYLNCVKLLPTWKKAFDVISEKLHIPVEVIPTQTRIRRLQWLHISYLEKSEYTVSCISKGIQNYYINPDLQNVFCWKPESYKMWQLQSVTATECGKYTLWQLHSVTAKQFYNNTAWLLHNVTTTLCYSYTLWKLHILTLYYVTATQRDNYTVWLLHSLTATQYDSFAVWHLHSLRATYFPTQQSVNGVVRCIGESKINEFQKFFKSTGPFCRVNSIKASE